MTEICDWGHPKNGLCWVWASQGINALQNLFGEWRTPTKEEWDERPTWGDLVDHCHAEAFNGGNCYIAHIENNGLHAKLVGEGMTACRDPNEEACASDYDLIFVKPQSKYDEFQILTN